MASAVVGALRVLLELNASQMESEFGKATVKIGEFDKFTQNAGRNLQRMVEGFSGQKIVSEATAMAAAIQKVGGVAALTDRELKRVAGTVNEATAKMRAMGVEIPSSLSKVKGELDALGMGAQKAGGFFGALGKAGSLLGPLLPIASITGLTTAIVSMGTKAIESADQLADLAERTGLSTKFLQQMQHVADQTGGSVETFTSAAFRLGVNLQEGTTKARDAVAALGLEFDQLKAQRPEDQYLTIIKALEGVESVQERNRIGVALFGKQFAEMAASVSQGFTEMANAADVVEDKQIQALSRLDDAWTKTVDSILKEVQRLIAAVVVGAEQLGSGIEDLTPQERQLIAATKKGGGDLQAVYDEIARAHARTSDIVISGTERQASATRDFVGEIEDARDRIKNLTKQELTQLNAALKVGGEAAEEYAASLQLNELALKLYKEQQQQAKRATDDTSKSIGRVHGILTDQTKLIIDYNVGWTDYVTNQLTAAGATDDLTAMVIAQAIGLKDSSQTITFGVIPAVEKWIGMEVGLKGAIEQTLPKVEDQTQKQKRLRDASRETTDSLRNLAQTFGALAQIAGENNLGDTLRAFGQMVAGFSLAKDGIDAVGKGFQQFQAGNFASGFAQMASGILGVVSAMEQATRGTDKWMTALGGAATGFAFGGVWGAIAGAIIGYARGSHAAADEQRRLQEQIRKTTDELRKQANEMTPLIEVLGLSDDLERMFREADTLEELDKIREELNRINKEGQKLNDEFRDFFDLIENAGFAIPPELELFFDSFMGMLDPANKAKLQSLLGVIGDMDVPWEKMQQAAEKFGIDIGSLGQKFQAGKLKASATEIINAFEMLTKNGADVGGVLFGMRDEISALVRDARKFGTEIPMQMKPWIEELLRAGLLVDENGEALMDLSGIRFGPPIESQFDKILKKIEELIDRFIHLADVIGKVPKLPSDIVPEPGTPFNPDDRFQPFANGGLVTRPTLALLGERGPELVTPLRRYAPPVAVPIPNLSGMPSVSDPRNWAEPRRDDYRSDFREAITEMREDLKSWLEQFSDSLAVTMRDAAMGAV